MLPPPGLGRHHDLDDADDGVEGVHEDVEVGDRVPRHEGHDPVERRDQERTRRAHRVEQPVDLVDSGQSGAWPRVYLSLENCESM